MLISKWTYRILNNFLAPFDVDRRRRRLGTAGDRSDIDVHPIVLHSTFDHGFCTVGAGDVLSHCVFHVDLQVGSIQKRIGRTKQHQRAYPISLNTSDYFWRRPTDEIAAVTEISCQSDIQRRTRIVVVVNELRFPFEHSQSFRVTVIAAATAIASASASVRGPTLAGQQWGPVVEFALKEKV